MDLIKLTGRGLFQRRVLYVPKRISGRCSYTAAAVFYTLLEHRTIGFESTYSSGIQDIQAFAYLPSSFRRRVAMDLP